MPFLFLRIDKDVFTHPKEALFIRDDPEFYILQNQSESIMVCLRKRQAYPVSFCRPRASGGWEFGYGDTSQQPENEFLLLTISITGELTVTRDRYATLPLFYSRTPEAIIIGNEYEDVVSALSERHLSRTGLLESLAITSQLSLPFVEEVHLLREREILTYTANGAHLAHPSDRTWLTSSDMPPVSPRDFMTKLNSTFDHFIRTRLEGQAFAFEISGGLDSATLPQYYARTQHNKVPIASMLFPDKHEVTQRQKLKAIEDVTSSASFVATLNTDTTFPLARMITTSHFTPHYYEKIYNEASSSLIEQLERHGVKIICGGGGGDELFGNIVNPNDLVVHGDIERNRRHTQTLPPFVTEAFRSDYIKHTPDHPRHSLSLHSFSVGNNQQGNNAYIRHDIWPVSPFIDSDLYAWCQGLPAYLRANKNILRSYHQAHGYIEDIYHPVQNEDFGDFFTKCFRLGKYDTLLHHLTANSVTARLGYVDIENLMATYAKGRNTDSGDDLFNIYLWLSTEINLQYTPGLTLY